MSRRRAVQAFAIGSILSLAVTAAPAAAASQGRATAAALKALAPSHPGIVFGLPRPLPATARVGVTLLPGRRGRAVPRLGRRTWLFWGEEVCGAQFPHSSRLVLVDAATGRVSSVRALIEEPTINGRVPPFLATPAAYSSSRYRVASSSACVAPPATRRGAGTPAGFQSALLPEDLIHDCMVLVGDPGPEFQPNFEAMTGWADDIGLRHTTATPSLAGLRKAVAAFVDDSAQPCDDVLIYITGHGVPRPDRPIHEGPITSTPTTAQGAGPPGIAVHFRTGADGKRRADAYITPLTLIALVDSYAGKVDFKFKIDSCFSGRFSIPLDDRPNVRVVETSSQADETSFFHMAKAIGKDGSGSFYPPDGYDHGIPGWFTDHLVTNTTTNPLGADEFTNGNVDGLYDWASTLSGGQPDLAKGIAESAQTGARSNFAAQSGYTHINVTKVKPPRSSEPTGAAFEVFTHSGWAHDDPHPPDGGKSTVCVNATTSPPQQPGDPVSADMTTGPGIVTRHIDAKLAASGAVHLSFGISAPGHYEGTVTIKGVTANFAIDVPAPTGTTPDHGGEPGSSCP